MDSMSEYSVDGVSVRSKRWLDCNAKICFSYMLSVISSIVIVAGVYYCYAHRSTHWLTLSLFGIALILIGSCLYYSGNNELYYRRDSGVGRRSRRRQYKNRGLSSQMHLMATAPPISDSQFSLNMIPQYFPSDESESTASNYINGSSISSANTFSQIFSVNGQSYLIVPLTNDGVSSELKKVSRDERSCQTDDIAISKHTNQIIMRKDVELQTTPVSQMFTETVLLNSMVIETERNQTMANTNANQSLADASLLSSDTCSNCNDESLVSLPPDVMTMTTVVGMFDTENCSSSITDTNLCDNNSFNVNSNDVTNNCDEISLINFDQIDITATDDNCRATPPPSYDEVIDEVTDDDNEILVVNYGTL